MELCLDNSFTGTRKLEELVQNGAKVIIQSNEPTLQSRILRKLKYLFPVRIVLALKEKSDFWQNLISAGAYDFLIVNQGGLSSAIWHYGLSEALREAKSFYAILCRSDRVGASLNRDLHERIIILFRQAGFIVAPCRSNLASISSTLGEPLPVSAYINSPIRIPPGKPIPWPESEGVCLAVVGRLEINEKGHDLLLQALSDPKLKDKDWHLNIYGEGPDEDDLKKLAQSLDLDKKVSFRGYQKDLQTIWEINHINVLTSRSEGLPQVIMEAMSCGRPTVATRVGGVGELIREGETGFLCESESVESIAQGICLALKNRSELKEMGRLAAELCRTTCDLNPGKTLMNLLYNFASK